MESEIEGVGEGERGEPKYRPWFRLPSMAAGPGTQQQKLSACQAHAANGEREGR